MLREWRWVARPYSGYRAMEFPERVSGVGLGVVGETLAEGLASRPNRFEIDHDCDYP